MKDDSIYLEHIETNLKRIVLYSSGISKEDFLNNIQLQDACIRQIEIMGEATKRISETFKEKHPEAPWKDMAGMRDNQSRTNRNTSGFSYTPELGCKR
jgi:uncharacterized protein with HEPN domain